jgi:hypothetical protein
MRALCLVIVLSAGAARADKFDPIAVALGRLHIAAKCDSIATPYQPWCIAVAYDSGKVGELPAKPLVGLTIAFDLDKDDADTLRDRVSFAALAVSRDGNKTKVKLVDVTPTDAAEQRAVGEAIAGVTAVFKGKATSAVLPNNLATFVRGVAGAYPAARGKNEWSWTGKHASTARQVGDFWVVIELDEGGRGIWATVLTDRWSAGR